MSADKTVEVKAPAAETNEPPEGEREHRRSGSSTWISGVALIIIGLVFLLQNITSLSLGNWWALFILIPAIASLGQAWRGYRQQGKIGASARGSLTGGLILLLVAIVFLFGLDWGKVWPLFLVIIGLGALLTGLS